MSVITRGIDGRRRGMDVRDELLREQAMQTTKFRNLVLLTLFGLALSSCGVLPEQESYEDTPTGKDLEIPPDLTGPDPAQSMRVPGRDTEISEQARQSPVLNRGPLVEKGVSLKREGSIRWLVVEGESGEVWPRVRDFWLNQAWDLVVDEPALGLMETEWRQIDPDDPGFVSRVFGADELPRLRYKYRSRMEAGQTPGTLEIYVANRRLEEDKDREGVWNVLPPDRDLEAEMLIRMVVYLGADPETVDRLFPAPGTTDAPAPAVVNYETDGAGNISLVLETGYSDAWRRTGLILDRSALPQVERDRARGLFVVHYEAPEMGKEGGGLLSKLWFFGGDDEEEPVAESGEFQISLIGEGTRTRVVILNPDGERDNSPAAEAILKLMRALYWTDSGTTEETS
ncbi:MAG: outer membrane protein assembly factor BamC [Gammaproteobacteria bacterium]|nr:MAG: outer membrane protein assembly factor BamC [Gammaproteobacteria bacterium]